MTDEFDPVAYIAQLREESPELEGVDAEAAARADREVESARRMNERDVVTGSGARPQDVVSSLLGTPQGDESAAMFGLELGDFSVEQITAMHRNGVSWKDIAARATGRRNIVR